MNGFILTEQIGTAIKRPAGLAMKVLVIIAVLYTLYFCRTLLLPILVAGFVALFSSPLVKLLLKIKIPRPLAAAFIVGLLVSLISYLSMLLVGPASYWLDKL